jgi:hypothetical protein
MQSLNIKQLAEPSSWVIASAVLINCPTIAVTAITIPSGYFVPTISTNYYLYYSRTVLLLDLFYYQTY